MPYNIPADKLKNILEVVEVSEQVSQLWLFGSRARGDNKPNSDIDLLIVGNNVPKFVLHRIREAAGLLEVDFVMNDEIEDAQLASELDRDKVLLYSKRGTLTSSEILI